MSEEGKGLVLQREKAALRRGPGAERHLCREEGAGACETGEGSRDAEGTGFTQWSDTTQHVLSLPPTAR